MKFTIIREELLEPLSHVYSIIESRQILPILSNVLLVVEENTLSMTGTDTEMELITDIGLMDSEPGRITVSARKFFDICRTLPTGAKMIFIQEGEKAVIRSDNSRFVLGTLPVIEYPNTGILTEGIRTTAKQGNIKQLIELTQFAMAHRDVRYWLNGLLLEISKGGVRSVATDGHRLALAELDGETGVEGEVLQVIVPRKGVMELAKMLGNGEEDIELCIGSNALQAEFSNARFTTKLIDGRYPDYSGVLPKLSQCSREALVEKESLRQTLIRAAILCSNETHRAARMIFDKDVLRISTQNMEREEADDEIGIDYTGKPLEIGFNVTYLLEAIVAIPTKEVHMYFKDVGGSCLIKPVGRDDCRYVVMPMRL